MLGARGHMLHEKIWKYLAVWCVLVYILIRLYLKKLKYFYIKNNYYSYSFAMRLVIAPGNFSLKTCHNWCVLVYIFIAFWKKKWFFSYRNNDISCTHARGHLTLRENFEECAIWCVLVNILIRFCIKIVFKVISLYRTIWFMLMGFQGIFPMNKQEI